MFKIKQLMIIILIKLYKVNKIIFFKFRKNNRIKLVFFKMIINLIFRKWLINF